MKVSCCINSKVQKGPVESEGKPPCGVYSLPRSSQVLSLSRATMSMSDIHSRSACEFSIKQNFKTGQMLVASVKFFQPNKPLHQHNNPNQTKSKQIRKRPGLMDASSLVDLRENMEKEEEPERQCVVLRGRGHHLAGFLRGGVWTEVTPRGGGLKWNFSPKH